MSDPLYDLLSPHLPNQKQQQDDNPQSKTTHLATSYLSRLLSLSPADLTTTEPQSLTQAHHSNSVSLQALSSRSHKSTTTSATHLSTLSSTLQTLTTSTTQVRESIPALDEAAVTFAKTYARGPANESPNPTLQSRRDSMLLSRQADKLTDILDLPTLLSTAIASAGSGAGGANYSPALDLSAHIKRLSIVYPDSALVRDVQAQAEIAMRDMTTNLLLSLRTLNIRLATTIRTIGWLRRVAPELSNGSGISTAPILAAGIVQHSTATNESTQLEGSFGALFLVSRLHTFLTTTEALAPLRELADQETERRISLSTTNTSANTTTIAPRSPNSQITRRPSTTSASHGTHTERYLKRYIEVFREQSFSTISMYRNVFPQTDTEDGEEKEVDLLALPSALQQFPLHLVEIFMEVLRMYLPNVTDPAARESLLMQVLYAANSLGRLGADFSMMISLLDDETKTDSRNEVAQGSIGEDTSEGKDKGSQPESEWARIIKKHRVQAARLDALAAGQNQASRRTSDIAVR